MFSTLTCILFFVSAAAAQVVEVRRPSTTWRIIAGVILGIGVLLFIISSLIYYKRRQARRRMVQQVLGASHPYNPGPGYYPNYYGQQSYGGPGYYNNQPQQFGGGGYSGYTGNAAYPPPPQNNFGDSKTGNPTGGYVPPSGPPPQGYYSPPPGPPPQAHVNSYSSP
ncbi:hypothetical protein K435DRAFT_781984 [Dendrothele bispora CBS 962.96]|uniref:Uncharacterized protein n=1 Tax=Dendrothele bispora (strain CBS 962.96) TaxID=1314807 RepID=A0A4S8LHM9_DENBC|nr:hypothetical protein K435DRAFT_781984 [Dendrothele bispora CBS 962.96]